METAIVKIYSNDSGEERIIRIEKKYLKLLDMVYNFVDAEDLFNYRVLDELELIIDFTK